LNKEISSDRRSNDDLTARLGSSGDDPLVLLGYTQRRYLLDIQNEREFCLQYRTCECKLEAVVIPMGM
jgi:hypothetical protein